MTLVVPRGSGKGRPISVLEGPAPWLRVVPWHSAHCSDATGDVVAEKSSFKYLVESSNVTYRNQLQGTSRRSQWYRSEATPANLFPRPATCSPDVSFGTYDVRTEGMIGVRRPGVPSSQR